jgi:hypothetical protein
VSSIVRGALCVLSASVVKILVVVKFL